MNKEWPDQFDVFECFLRELLKLIVELFDALFSLCFFFLAAYLLLMPFFK